MTLRSVLRTLALVGLAISLAALPARAQAQVPDSLSLSPPGLSILVPPDTGEKDVPYVPTSPSVVTQMLEAAGVTGDDVVYDLGSGDGRIPIAAAQEFGARAVGVEIDSALVKKARAKAREAGVSDQVTFRQGDLFETDLSDATVVTLYLYPEVNIRLRPKLLRELDPGDRIVSHDFRMGTWEPDRRIDAGKGNTGQEIIYLWTVPEEVPDELMDISDEVDTE
jgi:SAM-dependent methyltransferase